MKVTRSLIGLLLMLWLAGCATQVPPAIREAPPSVPAPDEVRADPERFEGVEVLWGGIIAGVENRVDHTLIQVVSRPLTRSGRVRDTDHGYGRFLARVPGFVDPAVYVPGRELTVSGRVRGLKHSPVGDYEYPYVLVEVEVHHLWPLRLNGRDPYYYDPWYPYHWDRYHWDRYHFPAYRPWPRF